MKNSKCPGVRDASYGFACKKNVTKQFENQEKNDMMRTLQENCNAKIQHENLTPNIDEIKGCECRHLSWIWRKECFKAILARNAAEEHCRIARSKAQAHGAALLERDEQCYQCEQAAMKEVHDARKEYEYRKILCNAQEKEALTNVDNAKRYCRSLELQRDEAVIAQADMRKELNRFIDWAKLFLDGYVQTKSSSSNIEYSFVEKRK